VNHLETYAMARAANVESSREILELATYKRPMLINYVSTLSVFSPVGVKAPRLLDEGSHIEDERHPNSRGYDASKWVGEKIFMTASERGIPCNIFRLGLVWADAHKGRYDEFQREYRIFKTCLLSGYGIRHYRYDMPPTPVDYVAESIVLLANRYARGGRVFHLSSPAIDVGNVFERCNQIAGAGLELLPTYEWIAKVKELHYGGQSLPAVPLVEFAFSMDERAFKEYERTNIAEYTKLDCSKTWRELEGEGLFAPVLTDEMLRVHLDSMVARDVELRKSVDFSRSRRSLKSGNA
jgi:thioester reductase-like protein